MNLESLVTFVVGGGLVGLLDWFIKNRESRHNVKRSEFELLVKALDELQEENARLQKRVKLLEQELQDYKAGVPTLLAQIVASGKQPKWMPNGVEITPPGKEMSYL
jgi:uncharacterized protein YlxW (UPF0749 family)